MPIAPGESPEQALDAAIDDHVGDDLLHLVFIACHPVLLAEARVAFDVVQGQKGPAAENVVKL